MTSTAVRVRQGQSQAQQKKQLPGWKQVMEVTKIKNPTQSCQFVKKLLVTSLSNITYVRNIFDEEAYASKTMGGVNLKILRETSGHKEAELLSSWVLGAMDAIEKKYLRELVFLIYTDKENPDDIHEKYTFGFSYGKEGQAGFQMSSSKDKDDNKQVDMDNVQEMTRSLLRNILLCTEGLPPLPKSAFLAIKLTYYDEVTPEDYEPEGFSPSNLVEKEMSPSSKYHVSLGEVSSIHHVLKLKVDAKTKVETKQALVNNNYLDSEASQSQTQGQSQSGVSCVCCTTTLDPLMLTCAKCLTSQHAACYKVLSMDQLTTSHYCVTCADQSHPCTDPKLVSNPHAMTCVFRRILVALRSRDSITETSIQTLLGMERNIVAGLVKKLLKEQVIDPTNENRTFAINKDTLETVAIPRFIIGRKKADKKVIDLATNAGDMSLSDRRSFKRTLEKDITASNEMEMDKEDVDGAEEETFSKLKRTKKSKSSSIFFEN